MRQTFDVGDIVKYGNMRGMIVERCCHNSKNEFDRTLHVDEYKCKIKFFSEYASQDRWVNAKHLAHISKIGEKYAPTKANRDKHKIMD